MGSIALCYTAQQKGKGMKYTKLHMHIGFFLLFAFRLDKWTLFYTNGLQRSLNADFNNMNCIIFN